MDFLRKVRAWLGVKVAREKHARPRQRATTRKLAPSERVPARPRTEEAKPTLTPPTPPSADAEKRFLPDARPPLRLRSWLDDTARKLAGSPDALKAAGIFQNKKGTHLTPEALRNYRRDLFASIGSPPIENLEDAARELSGTLGVFKLEGKPRDAVRVGETPAEPVPESTGQARPRRKARVLVKGN